MRHLFLLRHAKSDWSQEGARDFDRDLNARGKANAPLMGQYMAKRGINPDIAYVSPANRAWQTWELIAPLLQAKAVIKEPKLYETNTWTLMALVRSTPAEAQNLLIVGHNPALEDFATELVAAGEINVRDNMHYKFPTAALAHISFPITDWKELKIQSGCLEHFITPREIMDTVE